MSSARPWWSLETGWQSQRPRHLVVSEPSVNTIMEQVFGDPDWHQIVKRPGVWAWSRASDGWQEMKQPQQEETVTTAVSTEVNVGTTPEVPAAKLDDLAELVAYYDQLTEAINKAQVDQEAVKKKIQAAMGEAKVATLGGVPMFTFQAKESWRTADIKKAMPHLVAQYVRRVESEVIDWDAFISHHRDAVAQFQTREFRRVSGTRATRG